MTFVFHKTLQVASIKLHVTDLLHHNFLDLVTILLLLVLTLLHWFVDTFLPRLHRAHRLKSLLLALVTDLPGLLLAVLGVAVLLCLLRASLHLELTDLLWLEMAVLLLNREGEDVGELLAISVNISLANFNLNLSWDVIAALSRFPIAHNTFGPIPIILSTLIPLAVKLHGICAGDIVDNLLLHVAVGGLHVGALIIILGGHVDLVCGVADPVLTSEAPLHLVGLFQCLVVNSLDQVTHQFIHVETDSLDIGFYNSSAVLEGLGCT